MNTWEESFVFSCPRDKGAENENSNEHHTAVELRAPVDLTTMAAIGKALRKCCCGAELVVRGQKGGGA